MENGIQIIGVVVGIGVLHIHHVLFQLNEQQRDSVDKADDVCAAAVQVAVNLQFLDGEKMVIPGILKVNDSGIFRLCSAAGPLHHVGDTVANEKIFFLVGLKQRSSG